MPKYLVSHYVVINLEEKNHNHISFLLVNDNLSIFRSLFRNDGIIIAITVWQVMVESTSSVGLGMIREYIISSNLDKLILNLVQLLITYFILPSFYLLGDNRFRLALKNNGILKSIWTALKQKYEK